MFGTWSLWEKESGGWGGLTGLWGGLDLVQQPLPKNYIYMNLYTDQVTIIYNQNRVRDTLQEEAYIPPQFQSRWYPKNRTSLRLLQLTVSIRDPLSLNKI